MAWNAAMLSLLFILAIGLVTALGCIVSLIPTAHAQGAQGVIPAAVGALIPILWPLVQPLIGVLFSSLAAWLVAKEGGLGDLISHKVTAQVDSNTAAKRAEVIDHLTHLVQVSTQSVLLDAHLRDDLAKGDWTAVAKDVIEDVQGNLSPADLQAAKDALGLSGEALIAYLMALCKAQLSAVLTPLGLPKTPEAAAAVLNSLTPAPTKVAS